MFASHLLVFFFLFNDLSILSLIQQVIHQSMLEFTELSVKFNHFTASINLQIDFQSTPC